MAGFLDVLLRGAMLTGGALALGGVVFVLVALRARIDATSADAATVRALRLVGAGGAIVALGQCAILLIAISAVGMGPPALPAFVETSFARVSAVRVALAMLVVLAAARLRHAPRGPAPWGALGLISLLLVGSSAAISHAAARLDYRPLLFLLDAVHQVAAAVWVGGLMHLLVWRGHDAGGPAGEVLRRFSRIALTCMGVLVAAGVALSVVYVADPGALLETAYGVMVLTKSVLLLAILGLGAANYRLVRGAVSAAHGLRLRRFVEVEVGLAVTVLFAAASLTAAPPAVDVRDDRATLREVLARFSAMPPRLSSPDIGELLRQTNPLAGGPETRLDIERQWSEFNHHWAGVFVLAMGVAAIAHGAGVRVARHWPLLMIGLALFLFVRNDPEVWPLGPIGFWASLRQPEIAQHRLFMVLVMLFGGFEWAVRAERLPRRPWAYVFPAICAVGGGLLLTHSHTVFSLKEAFLMEVTHAPIGVLGAFAGWARWLELRLPDAGPLAGRIWRSCLVAVGLVLVFYSEG